MKKLLLTLLTTIAFWSTSNSQLLNNTTWSVYNTGNFLSFYFHFSADTIYMSTDFVTYIPLSIYAEDGNTITYNDLSASTGCLPTDTGKYTFVIRNDSLLYTLISDVCPNRLDVCSNYHWIANTTGIATRNVLHQIDLFPNPSADGIFNLLIADNANGFDRMSVFSADGKLIFETLLSQYGKIEREINLTNFSSGIYLLKLNGSSGNKIFKMIR